MQSIAYKIEQKPNWQNAQNVGIYYGSSLDEKDGFIHLSTINQLAETLRLYFKGIKDLVIIAINLKNYGEELKWETSRGGDKFPHLFTPLLLDNVIGLFDAEYDGETPIIPQELHKFAENHKGARANGI